MVATEAVYMSYVYNRRVVVYVGLESQSAFVRSIHTPRAYLELINLIHIVHEVPRLCHVARATTRRLFIHTIITIDYISRKNIYIYIYQSRAQKLYVPNILVPLLSPRCGPQKRQARLGLQSR